MQFFTILAFVSAVAAVAVRRATPPSCSISCLTSPGDLHGCSSTDNACLCKSPQFVAAQSACFVTNCPNQNDLQQANSFANGLCLSAGVTLTTSGTAASTGTLTSATTSTGSVASPSATSQSSDASALSVTTSVILLAGLAAVALGL